MVFHLVKLPKRGLFLLFLAVFGLLHGAGAAFYHAAALEHISNAMQKDFCIVQESDVSGILTVIAGFHINRQLIAAIDLGQTKLLGETYVQQFCRRHFIVRTAWLYSYYGKNFVKTMVNLAKTHDTLNVVNDQLGNPTNAVDLAYHILKLAVSHDYGIYHCTGSGICSWYDFASEIIRLSGLPCTVKPVTSAQYKEMNPKSADRPAWSALENRALRCSVGDDMRDWKDAIQDFFNNWDGK